MVQLWLIRTFLLSFHSIELIEYNMNHKIKLCYLVILNKISFFSFLIYFQQLNYLIITKWILTLTIKIRWNFIMINQFVFFILIYQCSKQSLVDEMFIIIKVQNLKYVCKAIELYLREMFSHSKQNIFQFVFHVIYFR